MEAQEQIWLKLLKGAIKRQKPHLVVSFRAGGGHGDGQYRRAIGAFNGYVVRRDIELRLEDDGHRLQTICVTGDTSPDGVHGIEFRITSGWFRPDVFLREVSPAITRLALVEEEVRC